MRKQHGQYCKAPDKEEAVDHSASEFGLKWEEGPLSGVMERRKGEPVLNKAGTSNIAQHIRARTLPLVSQLALEEEMRAPAEGEPEGEVWMLRRGENFVVEMKGAVSQRSWPGSAECPCKAGDYECVMKAGSPARQRLEGRGW